MNWRGPFEKRSSDIFGLGVSYLAISPAARQFRRDLVAFSQATSAYASNFQLVINPNAGIPSNFG